MNKKADSYEVLVFTLLVVAIYVIIFLGMVRVGNQASFYEQTYSKEIALVIDKAKPGMEVEKDVLPMYRVAEKNDFSGSIVEIDNDLNEVRIRLSEGKGYSYYYFGDLDVIWELDSKEYTLYMKFEERENA